MHRWIAIIVVMLVFLSCSRRGEDCICRAKKVTPGPYDPVAVISAMESLNKEADNYCGSDPGVFEKGNAFDPCRYFSVLTRLCPPEGEVLDYDMVIMGGDGCPSLHFHKKDEKTFKRDKGSPETDNVDSIKSDPAPLYQRIRTDGSLEGYFELVLFDLLHDNFCLLWHFSTGTVNIVATRDEIQNILKGLDDDSSARPAQNMVSAARAIDPTPRMRFLDKDNAEITLVTFTPWGGFYRRRYIVTRAFPHSIREVEYVNLVKYDCGIQI